MQRWRRVGLVLAVLLAARLAWAANPPTHRCAEPLGTVSFRPQDASEPLQLYRKSWAVVVGIDAYEKLPRLGGAVRDARAMAQVLQQQGFEVRLLLDGEATRAAITRLIADELPDRTGPDDRVLVYFAGHGMTRGAEDAAVGYLMPIDAEPQAAASTGISMTELQRWFSLYPARHILYVADACYSGLALGSRGAGLPAGAHDYVRQVAGKKARISLVAGANGEQALEFRGHGLFTYHLLEALEGAADANGDGLITSDELAAFVKPAVAQTARREFQAGQTPQYARQGEGEFLLLSPRGTTVRHEAQPAPETPRARQARRELDALSAAQGEPLAPVACLCSDPAVMEVLGEAAQKLVGGRPGTARSQDEAALALLATVTNACGEAQVLQARARLYAGQPPESVLEATTAAAKTCPGHAVVDHFAGSALVKAGRLVEAETAFARAIAAAPGYEAPQFNLGILMLLQKKGQAALPVFAALALRAPDKPEVFVALGQAQALLGHDAEAKAAWCRAKKLGSADAARLCP